MPDPAFTQIIRLGQKQATEEKQTRPIKIKLSLKSQRREVLINSKELSKSKDEMIKKVSISKDLTKDQREEYKKNLRKPKKNMKKG